MPYSLPEAKGIARHLVSASVVGFLRIRSQGEIVSPDSLGSVTLVRFGEIYGVLTAAHVLDVIPEHTPVGLMMFTRIDGQGQFKFEVGGSDKLYAEGWRDSHTLPDLGFLRLHEPEISRLKDLGCVFYNLQKARPVPIDPATQSFRLGCCITGVVGESKTSIINSKGIPVTHFTMLLGQCGDMTISDNGGFNLTTHAIEFGPGLHAPGSYGGVSGGALWFFTPSVDSEMPQRILAGVAFREIPDEKDGLRIICHFYSDIERRLLPLIAALNS